MYPEVPAGCDMKTKEIAITKAGWALISFKEQRGPHQRPDQPDHDL
jgi:hypothetical protein